MEFINSVPFLKGLCMVIFLHWVAFNLVEFQFTKAVLLAHENSYEKYSVAEYPSLCRHTLEANQVLPIRAGEGWTATADLPQSLRRRWWCVHLPESIPVSVLHSKNL